MESIPARTTIGHWTRGYRGGRHWLWKAGGRRKVCGSESRARAESICLLNCPPTRNLGTGWRMSDPRWICKPRPPPSAHPNQATLDTNHAVPTAGARPGVAVEGISSDDSPRPASVCPEFQAYFAEYAFLRFCDILCCRPSSGAPDSLWLH